NTLESKSPARLYEVDVPKQIVIIGVSRESKGCIDLVAKNRAGINGPTTDQCHTFARNFLGHGRAAGAGWTYQHLACYVIPVVSHVFAKRLAQPFVNAGHLINRAMQHRG